MATLENRTEALIADDEEAVRTEVAAAIREVLPHLNVQEFDKAMAISRKIRELGKRILLIVIDGNLSPASSGWLVIDQASRTGIRHIALCSTIASTEVHRLEGLGIKCVDKSSLSSGDTDGFKRWLETLKSPQE